MNFKNISKLTKNVKFNDLNFTWNQDKQYPIHAKQQTTNLSHKTQN